MADITKILMERDEITEEEAKTQIDECREALYNGDFEAINFYLGLEDDYIFDLI